MYTGLISHCTRIAAVVRGKDSLQLTVSCNFSDLEVGQSIAIDGMCVTVTDCQSNSFSCHLTPESLKLTCASCYQVGQHVNLERPLQLSQRLDGHFVTGHIDQTVQVASLQKSEVGTVVYFSDLLACNRPCIIPKCSIALNGVSLTVNLVNQSYFSVMLIPHTSQVTNLRHLELDQRINLECDLLLKAVYAQLPVCGIHKPIT